MRRQRWSVRVTGGGGRLTDPAARARAVCLVSSLELVLAPVPPQVWLVAVLAVAAEVLMPSFGSHRRTSALAVVVPVVMEVSIE